MTFEELSKKYSNFYNPQFQISVDGADISLKHLAKATSVTFEDAIDVSHRFSFTLDNPPLKWLEDGLFEPSKLVEIKMGYLDALSTMIVGEVTSLRLSFPSSGLPQLEVSGYDLFHQFTRASKNKTWKGRDSEVVKEVIRTAQAKHKLTCTIKETQVVHPEIVQDNETDYAFLKRLASRNFFEFSIENKDIYFGPPRKNVPPITILEYGKSLLSFTSELNIANQASEVIIRGWDPKAKKEIVGKAQSTKNGEGQSGGELMAKLYGKIEKIVTDKPVFSKQEANNLAQSILNRQSVSLLRGNAECVGLPEIKAGNTVILKGLGKKFSQKYFIERSTHNISSSGYRTTFSVRGKIS
jgi:phage protein D